jgi:fungal nitric oxide reductase
VAIKDITINGTLIKAGDGVIAACQSGNRDETAFPNPDAFDIHRPFDLSAHRSLAYGHGVHQCVAEWLAMAELEISLRSLFAAMPNLRLAVDPKDIKYSALEADVGIVELPVSWK